MQDRPLKFDPGLCPAFFTKPADKSHDVKPIINFPLPPSPELWGVFMTEKNGETFEQFRQGASNIIQQLCAWVEKAWSAEQDTNLRTRLIHDAQRFIGDRINTHEGTNSFPLFHDGVPLLAKIIQLINSDETPLSFRKTVVESLIDGMLHCPSGSYTNIEDAYWQLVVDMPGILMGIRRQIAIQTAQGFCADLDIHTANGVINYYADTLGVPSIEDDRLPDMPACREDADGKDPRVLHIFDVADYLRDHIAKTLTLDAVVDALIARLNIDMICENFNNDNATEKLAKLEQMLMVYGNDDDFGLYNVLNHDKLGEEIYQLKDRKELIAYLRETITNRLVNCGYARAVDRVTIAGMYKPAVEIEHSNVDDDTPKKDFK